MQKLVILAVCARLMQRSVHGWRSPCPLEHQAAWVGLEEAGHTPTPSPEWLSIPCDWVFPSPCAVAQVIWEKAMMELSGSLPAIARCRAPLGEVVFSQHWLMPPGTPCPDLITAVLRGRHTNTGLGARTCMLGDDSTGHPTLLQKEHGRRQRFYGMQLKYSSRRK